MNQAPAWCYGRLDPEGAMSSFPTGSWQFSQRICSLFLSWKLFSVAFLTKIALCSAHGMAGPLFRQRACALQVTCGALVCVGLAIYHLVFAGHQHSRGWLGNEQANMVPEVGLFFFPSC